MRFPQMAPAGLADGLANVRYAITRSRFAPVLHWVPRSGGLVTRRIRRAGIYQRMQRIRS